MFIRPLTSSIYENYNIPYLLLMAKQLKSHNSRIKKPRVKVEETIPVKHEQDTNIENTKKQDKVKKEKKLGKKNRLIIRNIVFDIREKHLRKLFEPYGQIVDIQVPLNPNNQKCNKGFAFVEFASYRSCQKVIKELNQTTFKGRPIVIDFSIAKTKFMTERIQEEVVKEKQQQAGDEHQFQNGEEEEQPQAEVEDQIAKPQPNNQQEDLSRTIFIRNMPINVEEETLKTFCAQYGKVKWAKIVIDKETKVSKGTAFVKFLKPQHAKSLIQYSKSYELFLLGKNPHFKRDPKINLELEGTIIKIFPVERREAIAEKMKERNEAQEKKLKKLKPLKKIKKLKDLILYDKNGKRNIALASLGLWEANQSMSEVDQQKFKRHAREKIEKLKNPNNIVSDRRVILKYLDKSISESQIKDVAFDCLSANKVPHKQLTYCKLMLDNQRQRSAGYAFLQFKHPEVAKMFVEQLAENQEALMPQPFVVEFSVQDSRKDKKLIMSLYRTTDQVLQLSMTEAVLQEQIQVSGSLLNITLFEDKIMRNFLLISNKLRKLETLYGIEQKQKAMEKEFKFLTMKVDSIVEKLPKDAGSLTRNDAKNISKETFYDIFNSNEDKLKTSKYHQDLLAEIEKVKDVFKGSLSPGNRQLKREGSKTSFTAGMMLRDSERQKDRDKEKNRMPKESLQQVLDDKEMEIVSQIVENKNKQKGPNIEDLSQKFDELTKIVQELRLGRGYASYLERQAEKYQRFEKFQEKSRQTARKLKDKPIQLQGIKAENVKGEILKSGLLNEVQRMELNKQEIARHELMQKRTFHSYFPKDSKAEVREFADSKEVVKGLKERDPYVSSLRQSKDKQGFKRSQSIRKLDKLQRRLRVDDLKDLNSVLREIELRIQTKVSHDIFMGFVKDFQEKLETLRISKDNSGDIGQIRKNLFVVESKVQSIVGYLQSVTQEDEALIVRKQWNCVSCDKALEKYQGKVGQHLNWESMAAKKLSPSKAGAFGQTGQLAAKIRNLMEGNDVQQ